jgi:2',3'-cyclic-nucleotide 2'-phosphodiesterase (5'-nucleotidase family)
MKKFYYLIVLVFIPFITSGQIIDSKKEIKPPSFVSTSPNIKEITIFHWNDLHSKDVPYQIKKKDTTYLVGGTANMLGYLKKYRNENSLVLNAGDDFQGSPISTFTRGKSQIELMNLYGLDAFEIGNHEFDYGIEALDSALNLSGFEYLAANINIDNNKLAMRKPFITKSVNGVKIGIIGLAPNDLLELIVRDNAKGLTVLNTDSIITVYVKKLKEEKCNVIVLLSHQGIEADSITASKFYGDVDIIIGGHSHTTLKHPKRVNGVIICQAGYDGRYLGKLEIKVDTEKDTVIFSDGNLIETIDNPEITDQGAKEKVDKMMEGLNEFLGRVIGKLEVDWVRSRSKESNIGQWIADATRKKANTDITFLNAGGIRKNLNKGDITVKDIMEICPFRNTIVSAKVSGKTLKQMLRNNIIIGIKEKGDGDLLIVSGIYFEYDLKKISEGSSEYLISVKVNGAEVDESKEYTISTNNYMASQMKKFFGDNIDIKFTDTHLIDSDILIEAVENQKVINNTVEIRINEISGN